jgi:hypothetical protein
MIKRDYLERMIEEVAAIAARALGLAREERYDEASREIDAAYSKVGIPALVLDRLDPASIRLLAGDRSTALIELLEADGELAHQRGDDPRAKRRRTLAATLRSQTSN